MSKVHSHKKHALAAKRSGGGGGLSFTMGVYLANVDFDKVVKDIIGDIGISLKWLNKLEAGK